MKRHKLTPEQVYAIKVPMAQGAEPLTLGQLKDRVGELVDLETRELQFDERRVKAEGDLLRAQTEMRELLALVPKDHIKPEMVEKIRKRHEATQAAERRATWSIFQSGTTKSGVLKTCRAWLSWLVITVLGLSFYLPS
jgi:hypothetical protein